MGKKYTGGVITNNLREGFRSEYLAHFVFSSFGPAHSFPREDDYGLDLLCNISESEGSMLIIKSTYGVQVKSEGSEFKFKSIEAVKWLYRLQFPFFLAEVSKSNFSIKIYSTWNINKLFPCINFVDEETIPKKLIFKTDEEQELKSPDKENGIIPVGKPILHFRIDELREKEKRLKYWRILNEWVEMDVENYKWRIAGIPKIYGYIDWDTNRSINEYKVWDLKYFFSPEIEKKVKTAMVESIIINGAYTVKSYKGTGNPHFKKQFEILKAFKEQYLEDVISKFGRTVFDEEL